MTVMGDASMDGLSDAGSIPARSTNKNRFKSSKIKGWAIFLFADNLITFDYLLKQENNIKKGESCTYDN